jgi:hypothetical protein
MERCDSWVAWYNRMPRAQPTLHVSGACEFSTGGHSVRLRPAGSPRAVTSSSTITGPTWASRNGEPPVFRIETPPDAGYAVEVATRPEAFDPASHPDARSADRFFGSWREGPLLKGSRYALPGPVWGRMKSASRLYFRLLTSDRATEWSNAQVTTPDQEWESAPFLWIIEPSLRLSDDMLTLVREVETASDLAPDAPSVAPVRYDEPGAPNYLQVLILPDEAVVEIQEAF